MEEKTIYNVLFEDVLETDVLVFKLIFTVSEKASNRRFKYVVTNTDNNCDIVITTNRHTADKLTGANRILLVNQAEDIDESIIQIRRPLIATRVLMMLDKVSKKLHAGSGMSAEVNAASQLQSEDEKIDTEEFNFYISEKEASELAIVEDESLSNPANEQNIAEEPDLDDKPASSNQTEATLVPFHRLDAEIIHQRDDNALDEVSSKPKSLVVDDSPSVRKQIELELNLFDTDIDFAESYSQAIECMQNTKYDVAFLDVVLPDGDGFQICKEIKHSGNETKVVMLTGKSSAADKIKGTMVGCDDYLVKPVGRSTFQNTVCDYLKLREQTEAINA